MRVLFLDLDGVLTTPGFERAWGRDMLDPVLVARLEGLVRALGPRVVISSGWRLRYPLEELRARLAVAYGGPSYLAAAVCDVTPHVPYWPREAEIALWLREQPPASFVILDDRGHMGPLTPYLVRTRTELGLQLEDVTRAAFVLGAGG